MREQQLIKIITSTYTCICINLEHTDVSLSPAATIRSACGVTVRIRRAPSAYGVQWMICMSGGSILQCNSPKEMKDLKKGGAGKTPGNQIDIERRHEEERCVRRIIVIRRFRNLLWRQ